MKNQNNAGKIPGTFSAQDIRIIIDKLKSSFETIEKSNSPREIVLSTWLVLDWMVRHYLASGLELHRFRTDLISPEYSYLPKSFNECCQKLQTFLKDQRRLGKNDPWVIDSIKITGRKYLFLKRRHPELLEEIILADKEYEQEIYGRNTIEDLTLRVSQPTDIGHKYTREVNDRWLESLKDVDSNWFNNAERINKARNTAVHDIGEDKIYLTLGINGSEKIEILRKKCTGIISTLTGVDYFLDTNNANC